MAKKKKAQAKQAKQASALPATIWVRESEGNETSPIFFCNPQDEWGFLSHWYPCSFRGPPPHDCEDFPECDICHAERKRFSSLGQYMEYYKATHFNDQKSADQILATSNSNQIMTLSKKISGFQEFVWDEVKYNIMVQANIWKFGEDNKCKANDDDAFAYGGAGRQGDGAGILLRDILLSTRTRELVDASIHDKIWGIGFTPEDARAHTEDDKWMWGKNLLGKALSEVRMRIRDWDGLGEGQNAG